MRAVLLLLTAGATWYMAGMYRSAPLLALLVLELLLAVTLRLLPFFLRRRLTLSFDRESSAAEKGETMSCRVLASNTGALPIGRLRLDLVAHYPQDKRRLFHRRLWGGAFRRGESSQDFTLTAPYCGLVELWLLRARVYDYLSIFSARKRVDELMQIAVLPPPRSLRLTLTQGAGSLQPLRTAPLSGDSQELRQLRSYRDGENARRVHWPLSARTNELWVKEYEREDAPRVCLLLYTGGRRRDAADWGDFYEVLSALVLGLLENGTTVEVFWREEEGVYSYLLQSAGDREELLFQLYQSELTGEKPEPPTTDGERLMTLDLDLVWTCDGETICRFPRKKLETTLANSRFTV